MSNSRRKLLKSIAAGSGAIIAGKSLPEKWSRPVVDSVLLPAHALTSNQIYSSENVMTAMNEQQTGGNSLLASMTNSFIPEASAGALVESDTSIGCATVTGSMLEFEILYSAKGQFRVSGALPLNMQVVGVLYEECGLTTSADMQITSMSPTEVVLAFIELGTFTIPASASCVIVPPLDCP